MQADGAVVVDPNAVDVVYLTQQFTTAGLNQNEYGRVWRIAQDYYRCRFVGCSIGLKRVGDTQLLASGSVAAPAAKSVAMVNKAYSRMRSTVNTYQNTLETSTNPVGLDSCANVVTIPSYGYAKLYTYKVPKTLMQTFTSTMSQFFPEATSATIPTIPATLANRTIRQLMTTSQYPGISANISLATEALIGCDMHPNIPTPANDSTAFTQHTTNFVVFKKFYFELQGPQVGNNVIV